MSVMTIAYGGQVALDIRRHPHYRIQLGFWNALQKKYLNTNIPSEVCCGSCIRLRGI